MTRLEAASIGMVWFGQLYLLLHPAVGTGLAVDLMMLLSLIERARQESIKASEEHASEASAGERCE